MDWVSLLENWEVKLVAFTLIVAAWIDGKELRVPNWITFPMVFSGLIWNTFASGLGTWQEGGLYGSLAAMATGLVCLLPLYAVGGMGAGDVKLMAGMGAWLASYSHTWQAFVVSVFVGAFMAIVMIWRSGKFAEHYANFLLITNEWMTIRNPRELAAIAAERKPTMHLLPYGIPICIGSIAYFLYEGMMI
ncbi:MAG: A24 family peptidase [Planctomycetota bacterium]|nr:A24 family peptidase [Planctomycetota bacterium]